MNSEGLMWNKIILETFLPENDLSDRNITFTKTTNLNAYVILEIKSMLNEFSLYIYYCASAST